MQARGKIGGGSGGGGGGGSGHSSIFLNGIFLSSPHGFGTHRGKNGLGGDICPSFVLKALFLGGRSEPENNKNLPNGREISRFACSTICLDAFFGVYVFGKGMHGIFS